MTLNAVVFSYRIQEEREERHKYKGALRTPIESELDLFLKSGELGSFDNGDPTTTNLYLGNLNPKVCEYFNFGKVARFDLTRKYQLPVCKTA